MARRDNRETMRRFVEDVFGGDLSAVDHLFAPGFGATRSGLGTIAKVTASPHPAGDSPEARLRASVRSLRTSFSDLTRTITHLVADGEWVWARWTVKATHDGPFMGIPPTGRAIQYDAVGAMRFDDEGLAVEFWAISDELSLLTQLGGELSYPANSTQGA